MSIAVAIVGSGIIGANHAAAVLRHPGLHLAAVVDTDDAARRRLADRVAGEWGAPPPAQFDSLAAALAAGGFDLVAVCTPSGLHADLAEQAIAAGRHVLVEKPLDASLSRARKLVAVAEEAERRGVLSTVVSQHRFDPASAAVAKAVADGRLGRITSAVASVAWWRAQDYYDSADWRGTCALDGGGALMNQGVHTVDLLCWLLGRPVEVYAHTARLTHEGIEVEDVAVATVRFESGALAALHATTAAYPGLAVRLQVHGDAGSAVLHDDQLEYFHAAATGSGDNDDSGSATSGAALRPRAVAGGPLGGAEPDNQAAAVVPAQELRGSAKPADTFVLGHLRQYQDVVSAIEDRRPPAVTLAEGLTAMAVVHAVYESAAAHKPVEVS